MIDVTAATARFEFKQQHTFRSANSLQIQSIGKHWIQKASPQPASRIDVARLREMLDQKLMERQARESGICPVREELFKQCFEEIIRQVTLNMPERGLLLLRVKRDIYSNISAY